ncbi:MAG: hypothetical protein AAF231_14110, partial [Pseudomonadota bacterium]
MAKIGPPRASTAKLARVAYACFYQKKGVTPSLVRAGNAPAAGIQVCPSDAVENMTPQPIVVAASSLLGQFELNLTIGFQRADVVDHLRHRI